MKKITLLLTAFFICASACFFLISCNNDGPEDITTPPNFEIVSSETFEVLETYENGWIKEAVQYNLDKQPILEFSYYPNGHLKSYRLYNLHLSSEPSLYLEHERSDADLPLRSKYYDLEGNLYADLAYENGLLSSKVTHYKTTQTIFTYENGITQSITKTDSDTGQETLITYDYLNGKRTLQVKTPGAESYTMETSLESAPGSGFDVTNDLPLLNLMEGNNDFVEHPVHTSFSTSLTGKTSVDIQDLCFAPIEYRSTAYFEEELVSKFGYKSELTKIKGLINSDFNRGIMEQYPFVEGVAYISKFYTVQKQHTLKANLEDIIAKTEALKAQYAGDFELLYGTGYFGTYFTGKNLLLVATIRNLPSDLTLRSQITDIAGKYAEGLLTGTETVTAAESELLSHVFFQLKAHSNVLGVAGQVINSYEDYQQIVEQVDAADPAVITLVLSRHF